MPFLNDPNLVSTNNNVGSNLDNASNKTVLGYGNSQNLHTHSSAKCYPTLANGVAVSGATQAWTLGNFTEIVPANTIAAPFDIHYINFEAASANDVYELVLYKGASGSEVEIGRIRTYRTTGTSAIAEPFQMPVQAANTRISAKVASASGNKNVTISVFYHTYA